MCNMVKTGLDTDQLYWKDQTQNCIEGGIMIWYKKIKLIDNFRWAKLQKEQCSSKMAWKKLIVSWNTTTVLIFKNWSHGSHKVLDKFDDSQMHGVSPDLGYLNSENM